MIVSAIYGDLSILTKDSPVLWTLLLSRGSACSRHTILRRVSYLQIEFPLDRVRLLFPHRLRISLIIHPSIRLLIAYLLFLLRFLLTPLLYPCLFPLPLCTIRCPHRACFCPILLLPSLRSRYPIHNTPHNLHRDRNLLTTANITLSPRPTIFSMAY